MGQYANQPDFITNNIKSIDNLNGFISDTPSAASYLGGSLIYIGGAGNIAVIPAGVVKSGGGLPTILDSITFAAPPQGAWFPVPVDYVMSTGTTATLLVAGK